MKISISQLRRIVREALVDQMREVPGPNSRDDADDSLDERPDNYMVGAPKSVGQVCSERTRAIQSLVIEAAASPELAADLDSALRLLQPVLKALESAHQKASDPKSKVVIAGVHSDLFNAGSYIRKVKSGQVE